jgi:hypothetical protein
MAQPTVVLELLTGDQAGTRYQLSGPAAVIGRSPEVDIPFPDERSLSRRHGEVRLRDGTVEVRDLGSQNGTFLNGKRLAEPAVLTDGARLRLGRVAFAAHVASAEPAAERAPVPAGEAVPAAGGGGAELARRGEGAPAAAGEEAEAAAPAFAEESPRRFGWLMVLLLVAIVAALYFLSSMQAGAGGGDRRRSYVIRRNEDLVVRMPRSLVPRYDDVSIHSSLDYPIVGWRHFDGLIGGEHTQNVLVITGRQAGRALVRVRRGGAVLYEFIVFVRGLLPEEDLAEGDRARVAAQRMEEASLLREEQPYAAMQRYLEAEDLFRLTRNSGRAQQAERAADEIRDRLSDQVSELYARALSDVRPQAGREPNYAAAIANLDEIMRLIPDPQSIDYQLANDVKQRIRSFVRRRR